MSAVSDTKIPLVEVLEQGRPTESTVLIHDKETTQKTDLVVRGGMGGITAKGSYGTGISPDIIRDRKCRAQFFYRSAAILAMGAVVGLGYTVTTGSPLALAAFLICTFAALLLFSIGFWYQSSATYYYTVINGQAT